MLWETADLMEIAGEDSLPHPQLPQRRYRHRRLSRTHRTTSCATPSARSPTSPASAKGSPPCWPRSSNAAPASGAICCCRSSRLPRSSFSRSRASVPRASPCIFEHYRISTIDELERLCREQKLRVLPRMGAKLEEKVLRSIAQYRQRSGRYLLSYAEAMAAELTAYLDEVPGVEAITPAGSLRRGRETVGDLDLLVTGPTPLRPRWSASSRIPRVEEVLGRGENKASAKVGREGLQVDVRALPPDSFGAAMQYFTGSKDHNVAIRTRAVKMGLKLSEYGLFRVEDESKVAGETEEERLRGAGPPLDSARAARELRRDRSRRRRPPARTGGAAAHPRRPPHAHHRDRRPRLARRNGRGRARARLRIHRHHRPFQGARHGQRSRRSARRGVRQAGARAQSRRPGHPHLLRHRVRHPQGRRAWTSPTTRWRSSTW